MAVAVAADIRPKPLAPQRLPPLREDIQMMEGPPTRDGAPTWTLYDPAMHRFVRIGRLEFEILCRWGLGVADTIADAVSAGSTYSATADDVLDVLRFAGRARLLQRHGDESNRQFAAEASAGKLSVWMWLLKNYLFIRVRLFNPDRFLAGLSSWVGFLFTTRFVLIVGMLALLGLYLVGRQWDNFTHAFIPLLSLQGIAAMAVALSFSKCIHELGHGLMARRMGCRVPGMGFALLVMWPMLWTDVTDAWRLTKRHQRLLIDAAGVMAEITLAVLASLAWSVLPDGPARTAAFQLATSTWLLTLLVNVNPLMRFDGYFVLSDWLDEPNLQERSFALTRWKVREVLFRLGDPPPEHLPAARLRLMIAYALVCWIYRFSLFMGIAVLVYHFTFKLLGMFLMGVEIGWFIVRPIVAEMAVWPQRLQQQGWSARAMLSAAVLLGIFTALFLPLRSGFDAPAVLRAERQTILLTSEPGQLTAVADPTRPFRADTALFVLESPDIAHEQQAALTEIAGIRARLVGQAFDPDARGDLPVAWQQLEAALAKLRGAEARAARLEVRSPYAGVLVDMPRELRPGVWLPRREKLGMFIDPSSMIVEALVDEADIARLHLGAEARFWPENGEKPIRMLVDTISPGALASLETPEQASVFGGGVAARKEQDGRLKPETAVYRVVLRLAQDEVLPPIATRRGTAHIAAERMSLAATVWRRMTSVVMREAGL